MAQRSFLRAADQLLVPVSCGLGADQGVWQSHHCRRMLSLPPRSGFAVAGPGAECGPLLAASAAHRDGRVSPGEPAHNWFIQ